MHRGTYAKAVLLFQAGPNETTAVILMHPWGKPIFIVSISGAKTKICAQLDCTQHAQCIGRRNPLGIAARRFYRPFTRFIKMKHNTGLAFPISHASFGWLREHLRGPRPQIKPHRGGLDRFFNTPNRHTAELIHCPHMTGQLQLLCRNNAGTTACAQSRVSGTGREPLIYKEKRFFPRIHFRRPHIFLMTFRYA